MRSVILGICLLFAASMVSAQNLGIQFDKMPVGAKLYYKNSQNETWVQTYKGKSGKFYIVSEKWDGYNSPRTHYYNSDGHRVKTRYKSGGTVKYTPMNCERVVGSCTYRYNGNPKYNGMYQTSLVKEGSSYRYFWSEQKTSEKYEYLVTFGKYNVLQEESWTLSSGRKRWRKLLRIE
ncbi:hypothetical protein [Actibacterium lipolyticum]|uniref:Uncharacterized protein n=1 Tax=Actibacterium lipolyticum TaxID=1524263 RepID=A0A238JTI2_9RHOB|nr:hypothetical protein [Actibacterium lipolyticum]SMX33988.1 hypothetical protein COL8621_01141 [Actibacterium lipolyticum]